MAKSEISPEFIIRSNIKIQITHFSFVIFDSSLIVRCSTWGKIPGLGTYIFSRKSKIASWTYQLPKE